MKAILSLILALSVYSLNGQMVLSGTATGSCDCYTLTTTFSQAGSVWSPSTIDLTKPFDFTFRIYLGNSDGGADGMVFVLRQSGTTTGTLGSLLGYGGILNSVGIEVDTWNSGVGEVIGDIASDHVGMNANGSLDHDLVAPIAIPNIEDGFYHDFRVIWDPVLFEMEVFLDGSSMFTYTGDLVTLFFGGDPNVYFGWTGATGGAMNTQSVCIDIEADIESDPEDSACPGQEIAFSEDTESGLIYDGIGVESWDWAFTGGGTADIPDPVHTFSTIGVKAISLTVTNLIGCEDETTLFLSIDSIDIETEFSDITCFGDDDGTGTAIPVTGEGPYDYLWDDPAAQTTNIATDLAPGTYTVLVTDVNGCQQTREVTITEPDEFVKDSVNISNATCGLDDGELIIYASGGVPDYEYSIDGITFYSDSDFVSLPHGPIYFEIVDANGCIVLDSAFIDSDSLNLELTQTNISCFEFDDGTATASPEFDVGPCTYLWDDPLGQVTPSAVDLAPGTYQVLVTHEIGCAGIGTVTITEPLELLLNEIAVTNASCGVNNGVISLESSGGALPYEYSIDGGTTFSSFPNFTDLPEGSYDLMIRDANGCIVTGDTTLLNVSNVPEIILSPTSDAGCKSHTVNITNLSDPLLTANTHWTFGDGNATVGGSVSHTYPDAGCYDIHVTVTTFDGCVTDSLFTDFVCVWELPIAEFSYTPDRPNVMQTEVEFSNTSTLATTYEWEFGDGSVSTDFNPTHDYPGIGDRSYDVRLIAITDKGCRDTAYQTVYVEEVVQYYVPNIFTPDGDPFNQNFTPIFMTGFTPADYHLTIYNRWGEIVFESFDASKGWDGTYGGKLVDDGTYIWQIIFKENGTDKIHEDFGHVNILK